jgi:biopolymer transport protein ExbB
MHHRRPPPLSLVAVLLLLLLVPQVARAAWWNADWSGRKPMRLDASATGANITDPIGPAAVLVRLYSGNFNFAAANADGSDLRFIAGDDVTPLEFHFEKYDSLLGEALVWVGVPDLKPGAATQLFLYYGNPKAAPVQSAKGTYDAATTLVYHFEERGLPPKDSSTWAHHASSAAPGTDTLIGAGVKFDGTASIELPAGPGLTWAAGGPMALSLWVKTADANSTGVLFSRREGANGFVVGVENGKPFVQLERAEGPLRGDAVEALPVASWHHLSVTAGDAVTVFVNGVQVASVAAPLPPLATAARLGADSPSPAAQPGAVPPETAAPTRLPGFVGEVDELQLSKVARPLGFLRASWVSQGTDPAKFVVAGQDEETGSSGGGYLTIILQSVTLDGWVVIGLLVVMFFISVLVMVSKTSYLNAVERANERFAQKFHAFRDGLRTLASAPEGAHLLGDEKLLRASSLYRLFRIAAEEVRRRASSGRRLRVEGIEAIRARMDSGLVRENQRLSERMVLLTIAISGGPFLGLLGTVVGVMITFASIAAAGDVNVNAIAPGIAAALVATVAGLAVAIPALFAYNWLLTRAKNVTATMQVFVDELVTSLAESFAEQDEASPALPDGEARGRAPVALVES